MAYIMKNYETEWQDLCATRPADLHTGHGELARARASSDGFSWTKAAFVVGLVVALTLSVVSAMGWMK